MLHDFLLYARLKTRLARRALLRALSNIVSSDLENETRIEDRLYQGYVLILGLAWLVVMWIFALDFTAELFFSLGAVYTQVIAACFFFIPYATFVFLAFRYARSSPWKMSHADMLYVAAGPIRVSRILFWEIMKQVIAGGFVGGVLGFLVGVGFQSGTGIAIPAVAFLLYGVISVACAIVWAGLVGTGRLVISREKNRTFFVIALSVLLCVLVTSVSLLIFGFFSVETMLTVWYMVLGAVLVALGFFLFIKLANNVDTIKAIEENAFYADMHRFRNMPLYDAAGYSEIQRKRRIANRAPFAAIPIGVGGKALVTRSAMSHIRQFDGIPHILFWGAFAAPTTVFLLFTEMMPLFWMVWAQMLLLMPKGVKEVTRVFRDDMNNRAISDHLPFSTTKLFLYDSALGFVACLFVSLVLTVLLVLTMGLSLEEIILALVISLAVNVALTFCSGIDGLSFFQLEKRMSYEVAALIFMIGIFLFALTGNLILTLGFLVAYTALLALMMRYS